MRKHLLIIAFTLAACFSVNAESVSASFAASKAATFLHLKSDSQLLLMKSPYETFYLFSIDGTYFDEEAFEDEYDDVDKFDFYDDVEQFEPDYESKDEDGDEDGPDDQSDPEAKHKGGNKGGGTLPPFHVPRGKKPFMN